MHKMFPGSMSSGPVDKIGPFWLNLKIKTKYKNEWKIWIPREKISGKASLYERFAQFLMKISLKNEKKFGQKWAIWDF